MSKAKLCKDTGFARIQQIGWRVAQQSYARVPTALGHFVLGRCGATLGGAKRSFARIHDVGHSKAVLGSAKAL